METGGEAAVQSGTTIGGRLNQKKNRAITQSKPKEEEKDRNG